MRNSILFFVILIPSIVWPETSVNITGGSVGKAIISPSSLSTEFSFDSGIDKNIENLNQPFAGQFQTGHYNFLNSLDLKNNEFMNAWFDQDMQNGHDDIPISEFPFFDQIESIRLIDGTIIQAEDLTDIDVLENKLTANHPIEFQAMTRNDNFGDIKQYGLGLARWNHNHQEGTFVSGIDTIRNYQRFLNRYLETGEIGNDYAGFHDVNIYHRFIEENREVLDEEKLKTLFSYWHTDFSSPAQLPRYQYNPGIDWQDADNFNWEMVQEDVKDAIFIWHKADNNLPQDSEDFVRSLEDSSFAYQYEDRIFINPFKREIAEIWATENTGFDIWDVREMMKKNGWQPAMIDLPRKQIQSIILEDGGGIFLEDFENLKELPIKPDSLNMKIFDMQ